MKFLKFYLVFTVFILFLSCGANPTAKLNQVLEKVYVGMPLSEFKEKVEGEVLVEMRTDITVYKIVIETYNDLLVATRGNGWRRDHQFFYFIDNKLVQVDKGERAVDYRVKID